MAHMGLALHAHTYAVSLETYHRFPTLKKSIKITQTDKHTENGESIEFIDAMESRDYPIFASMYHPEYQLLDFEGPEKWNLVDNRLTDEIAFRLSMLLHKYACKNTNRVLPEFEMLITEQM